MLCAFMVSVQGMHDAHVLDMYQDLTVFHINLLELISLSSLC